MSRDDIRDLTSYGFREVDEFVLVAEDGDLVVDTAGRVARIPTKRGAPSVYAWVACRSGSEVI